MSKKVLTLAQKFKMAGAILRGEVKALAVTAPDGASADITFTSDPPQVGDGAFGADAGPAPDGAYKLPDGSTATVAGGIVTEIKPADAAAADQGKPAQATALGDDVKNFITEAVTAAMKQHTDAAASAQQATVTAQAAEITALKAENRKIVQALQLITGDTSISKDDDTPGKTPGKTELSQEEAIAAHEKRKAAKAAKK